MLIYDDDKKTAKQAQCNHVGPEAAVLDGFFKQQLSAFINAVPVVLIGQIDATEREIEEALLRLRLLASRTGWIVTGTAALRERD